MSAHPKLITITAILTVAIATSAQAAWYSDAWSYRKALTLNGGLVPAAQTNFPVLVSLTDAHLGANAQADADDILFTAADGTTKLAHEIESYTSPAGTLVAWVNVPALASGSNTTIYMYYGNAAATSQQNATAVWDAGYRGVWHVKEKVGGAGAIKNSTANAGLDGTDVNSPTLNAAGQIDGAVAFDGTSDRRIAVTDPGAGSVLDFANGTSITVSAWIRPQTLSGSEAIVLKGDTLAFGSGLNYGLQTGGSQLFFSFSTSGSPFNYNNYTTSSSGMTAGNWYHVACTYTFGNAGSAILYVNGASKAGTWTSGSGNNAPLQSNDQLWFGDDDASEEFNGVVDEVRISSGIRSATWIQTEYNNQANQGVGAGKFILSLGAAEAVTRVYYSVGTSRSVPTDLKSGSPTITITSGIATFSSPQPNNVGVGDEIVYGGVTSYISGRLSSTQYTVTTRLGVPAADVGATSVTRIYRAFASLSAAQANSANGTHLGTSDLVTANIQLNWPCYNDGPLTDIVGITGHATGPANYIRVYAPVSASEVGVSQRHSGTFSTGFQLRSTNGDTIQNYDAYFRVEGLTIQATVNATGWYGGIQSFPTGVSDVRISHNIIKGVVTAGNPAYGIMVGTNTANVHRVWNNIVYNFPNSTAETGIGIDIEEGVAYVFNNTVYNCQVGITRYSSVGGSQATNNVSINDALNAAYTDYLHLGSAPAVTQSNNVSSDATATGAGSQTNKTAYAAYFVSTIPGNEDLHLRSTSFNLWGSNGGDLSADANLPVTEDIDGAPRVRPDIGADEFGGPAGPPMLVKSGRYTGNGAAGRAVFVGFQPDAVLVKRIAASGDTYAVLRTATMTGDQTKDLDNAGLALAGNLVQSLTPTGFTIGSDARVNANTVSYAWVAFKGASGEMKVGTYVGSGAATQSVSGVGFQPDYMIAMPEVGSGPGVPVSAGSTFPANTSFDFDATQAGPNCVIALQADGFQVGNGSGSTNCGNLTASSATFHYVAWKATPGRVAVGTYTGNGAATLNLDVAGFFPEWVIVKKYPDGSTQRPAIHKPASTGVNTDLGLPFVDGGSLVSTIKALRPLGFQVGNDERVNSSTACSGPCTYHWVAFGPHTATSLYRSVGTNGGDLNVGNTVTISGGTATFSGPMPDNVGVGDVLQYDPGTGVTLAFIYGRTSSQVYTVRNKDGADPVATPGTAVTVYRAYTSLFNWEAQSENPSINATVRDFDTVKDLTALDATMNVACYGDGADGTPVVVNGWTTGTSQYIRIYTPVSRYEVGTSQRHSGTWNSTTAYRLQANLGANGSLLWLQTNYVRVDGLQVWLMNDVFYPAVIYMNGASGVSSYQISNNIVRGNGGVSGFAGRIGINIYVWGDAGSEARIWNNLVYDFTGPQTSDVAGILPDDPNFTSYIYNNTVVRNVQGIAQYQGTVIAKNNLAYNNTDNYNGTFDSASANNLSGPGADPQIPATNARNGVPVTFVNAAGDDWHLSGSDVGALNWGVVLSSDAFQAFNADIDGQTRQVPWDIGADDASGTTAVKLMSFVAVPGDSSVTLEWRTGSELDNLGFHVYRSLSADGPWTRLTSSLIPGLGSSPLGRAYSWQDTGLTNGVRDYYRLEDVDTSSVSTFHGPVSAVPVPAPSPPGEGGGDGGGDGAEGGDGETVGSCPSWVLAAAPDTASPVCTKHGAPDATSLNLLSRDASTATLELQTGGFWTLEDASGTVRVFVPGLEFPTDAKAPALPLRRALVDAVVGKQVHLVSAEALDLQSFPGLCPSAVGQAEMAVGRDGTVRPSRRSLPARFLSRGLVPQEVARLAGTAFQGEKKSAVVEITPVRFSASRNELVLAGRVRVKLSFAGVAEGEIPTGSGGRALPRKGQLREVLAQLQTTRRGLYAVRYEDLFPTSRRGVPTTVLRLQRQGEAVPFYVKPWGPVFGPGSVLYFYADRTVSSTEYSSEVAYELVRGAGVRMEVVSAAPAAAPVVASSTGFAAFETNRIYQPGLLEASDIWLWDGMASGVVRAEGFALSGVDTASADSAHLVVFLQGGSESGITADHHVRVSVNGGFVGEATFTGKRPHPLDLLVAPSLLREGANELSVANVRDTGVYSLVFLDRFELSYPQASTAHQGVFEGVWAQSGTVEVSGLSAPPVILRDSGQPGSEGSAVKWITGFQTTGSSVRLQAEAGYRYTVVSPEGLFSPRIGWVPPSTLKAGTNQVDYLVIAPREFLEAALPLVERRRSQGLVSRAVSFEEIASEFGHGQPSAEAIRAFLKYAYHSWQGASPRYVVLLGDATYDPQHFLSTSWASPLPALWEKTTYLWTASDPALAAVNGEDLLPDLAIGRLPATTREQAEALVSKLLAWEDSRQGLSGKAVLVADTPDTAGDFEVDVEDIHGSFLADRSTTTLKVRELGAGTRPAILGSFDDGASLVSYVGHGGTAVWSSANVLNSWDAASLQAQSRQPLLLTLNCLNGYFVAPNFDSLSESLLKAEGRGAIAALSPSGLSLDGPAHQYHRALMAEIASGRHARLGDAILAAQVAYAETGLMPELLTVYQILGDPAMRIR
jgi:hypothetical protein